jgi:hypothetical protein
MGTTERFLALRGISPDELAEFEGVPTLQPLGELAGLAWSKVDHTNEVGALVAAVAGRLRNDHKGLVAQVEDSDYAFVIGLQPEAEPFVVFINPDDALESTDGQAAMLLGGGTQEEAIDRLVSWSICAPRKATASRIKAIVAKDWTFAEEGLGALLLEIGMSIPEPGLAGLEGAVRLVSGKPRVKGEGSSGTLRIDWDTSRFVAGTGNGFIGIWDRRNPGPPMLRFPPDDLVPALREALRLEVNDIRARKQDHSRGPREGS